MTDLDELYAVRITNEAIAMKLTVPTLRAAQFEALEAEMATMVALAGRPPARSAHQRFHDILHGGVGPRMRDLLHSLYRQAERYRRRYDLSERSSREVKQAEHAGIVDACRRGAEVEAAGLLVDHLASVALDLMVAERYAPRVLPLAIAQAKAKTELRAG
jgi:DNA-binding GntR family transcriptional regulator